MTAVGQFLITVPAKVIQQNENMAIK